MVHPPPLWSENPPFRRVLQRCTHPQPDVTINVWPNGCVCQAVRAPGSNVTLAQRTRAGSGASKSGSMRTVPVNQSVGPLFDGCDPLLLISISQFLHLVSLGFWRPVTPANSFGNCFGSF